MSENAGDFPCIFFDKYYRKNIRILHFHTQVKQNIRVRIEKRRKNEIHIYTRRRMLGSD